MPIDVQFEAERGWIRLTATGDYTLADLKAQFAQRLAQGHAHLPVLFDATGSQAQMSPGEVRDYSQFVEASRRDVPRVPVALVVNTDFRYGMARMYEMLSDSFSHVKVFRTMAEAEEWLTVEAAKFTTRQSAAKPE